MYEKDTGREGYGDGLMIMTVIYDLSMKGILCAKLSEMDGEFRAWVGEVCMIGFFRLLLLLCSFFINKNAYFVFSFQFISLQLMQNLLKSVSLLVCFHFISFHFIVR